MRESARAKRIGGRLLWLAAIAGIAYLAVHTVRTVSRPVHGFVANYAAGRVVVEDGDAARLSDDEWFIARVQRFEPDVVDIYGANLPSTALYMAPVALAPYRTARMVWAVASLVVAAGAVLWLARTCRLGPFFSPLFVIATLLSQPMRENQLHAQSYALILGVTIVAWIGYRRRSPATAGVPAGILLTFKTAGIGLWPLLAATRRYRALAWALATAAAAVLASLVVVGPQAWIAWVRAATDLAGSGSLAVTAYQTQTSLIRHLLVYDARWNPAPLADLPALAAVLQVTALLALLALSCVVAWRRPHDDRVFAAFATLTLILSPVTLDYHYVQAILPVAILLGDIRHRPLSLSMLLLLAGAALMALDLPYRSSAVTAGAASLLAYPRLYGAYLLWGIALHRAWTAPAGQEAATRRLVTVPD